jgi:DNA-binding transcriptional MerR regulator
MDPEFTSKQMADLVGVTVRTLRHYHQIGLLPEPARTAGGYRVYTPEHVLRLIRIKRLTSLGLSLEQAAGVLDDPGGTASRHLLDDLDRELARQVAELTAQRQVIAEMRRTEVPIDVLPQFADQLAALRSLGQDEAAQEADKMAIDVVAGLGEANDLETLRAAMAALTEGAAARLAELHRIWGSILPDTPEPELTALGEEFIRGVIDLGEEHLQGLKRAGWSDDGPIDQILEALFTAQINPQQREVAQRARIALAAHMARADGPHAGRRRSD